MASVDGSHPERRSALVAPAPFDIEAYRADPVAYCSVVEPGRMFQTASPGPDVPYLELLSDGALVVEQGQSILVKARTAPLSPISWHAEGLGAWPNGLQNISLAADEKGETAAVWTATSGVLGDVTLVGASPTALGQIYVHIEVVKPPPADAAPVTAPSSDPEENL